MVETRTCPTVSISAGGFPKTMTLTFTQIYLLDLLHSKHPTLPLADLHVCCNTHRSTRQHRKSMGGRIASALYMYHISSVHLLVDVGYISSNAQPSV